MITLLGILLKRNNGIIHPQTLSYLKKRNNLCHKNPSNRPVEVVKKTRQHFICLLFQTNEKRTQNIQRSFLTTSITMTDQTFNKQNNF